MARQASNDFMPALQSEDAFRIYLALQRYIEDLGSTRAASYVSPDGRAWFRMERGYWFGLSSIEPVTLLELARYCVEKELYSA